jgi:hypothetical protein
VWWVPGDEPCSVTKTNLTTTGIDFSGGGKNFNTVTSLAAAGSPGLHYEDVVIQPTALNLSPDPFPSRSTRLEFTSYHKVAHLVVRQENIAVVPSGVATSYLADGTGKSFTVKSNCQWIAEVSPADEAKFSSITTSGGPNTTGESFTFTLVSRVNNTNTNVDEQSIVVTFKSTDGLTTFGTATIKSHRPYLTLEYYSTTVNNLATHYFDVAISTNITSTLTASITTNPSNMLDGAPSVQSSNTVLRVPVKANSLVTAGSASVTVSRGGNTRTLSITFPAAYYNVGTNPTRKVSIATYEITLDRIALNMENPCPIGGGTIPNNQDQARWYLTYFSTECPLYSSGSSYWMTWPQGSKPYLGCYSQYTNLYNQSGISGGCCQFTKLFNIRCVIW